MQNESVDPGLASMLSTCAARRPWAEQDEGPYHRSEQPVRRNVVEDREGVALQLGIRLAGEAGNPLQDASVEIWQCDALGHYSGFPPPEAPGSQYLPDETFLRGRQFADSIGRVEFHTIYPGWYPGRTVHIHVMVHIDDTTFTSQLYFPDEVSDGIFSLEPYSQRPDRDTTNQIDEILPTGGEPAIVEIATGEVGYRAAICLVLPRTMGLA